MPLPQIITPFNVYFNPRYIYQKGELWRLVTNFLYFGNLGERPALRLWGSASSSACSLPQPPLQTLTGRPSSPL